MVWLVAAVDAMLILASPIVLDTAIGGGSDPSLPEAVAGIALYALTALYGVVGAIIATRHPHNAIGWMVWGAGGVLALGIFGAALAELHIPGATLLNQVASPFSDAMLQVGLYLITVFIPLYFPDGRLPSPRWRVVVWYAAIGLALPIVGRVVMPGAVAQTLGVISNIVAATAFVLALAATAIRFRAGDQAQRQQIKWLAAAAALAAVGFATAFVDDGSFGWILFLVGMALLPVAIGVAVMRYRLYEIDRIISRTLGYALVTGVLVVVFAGAVLGLQAALEPVTGGSTVAVAASTLVVAALFQPLRRRVQRAVDRRFDRRRYDGQKVIDAFTRQLRDEVDLDRLRTALVATADDIVRPVDASIWLRSREIGR